MKNSQETIPVERNKHGFPIEKPNGFEGFRNRPNMLSPIIITSMIYLGLLITGLLTSH